jgi:two-component system CheB/CheR fusion protein
MKGGKKTLRAKKVSLSKSKNLKPSDFPVVAIGSSAGGLEAALELFKNLSANTGMVYIYVQHISPDHKSLLTPILSKITVMKVQEVENMEHIIPNNIYVIPNDRGIEVTDGHIKVIPRSKGGVAVSIDILFSSLAQTHKENVVGIVLSGNAHDGTKGLKAIKDAGGITFAQDDSAQVISMPKSAIAAGVVDFILSPKEIAIKLNLLGKNGITKLTLKPKVKDFQVEEETNIKDNDPDLRIIIDTLQKKVNVDFSLYKLATIKRRINHRMLQCGIKTIKEYSKFLFKKNKETELLYKDLLINITSFFRDPETFQYLKTTFLPTLLKSKNPGETLRIWVPACSTGEEAYSLAMLITEIQSSKIKKNPVQIFATDLSEQAIKDARIGEYSEKDLIALGKRRAERFFTKIGSNYRIAKELRDMCVFAPHNILYDPPFSRIDLISCRNLLIYFDVTAQKKALATMNFALNEGGCLLLGKSETVGTASQFFNQISNTFKLYCRKKSTGIRKIPEISFRTFGKSIIEKNNKPLYGKKHIISSSELDRSIDSTLLSLYMPACVIINKNMEIIKFRGQTSLYLSHPPGNASLNILKMTRPEFTFELRNAINEVVKTNSAIFKTGIQLNTDVKNTLLQVMSLEARPLTIEWGEPLYLIVFTMQEIEKVGGKNSIAKNSLQKDSRVKKQIEELHKASAEMIAVIESQDRAYEDLQAANEEIISASEEFQTLNEELETSKEEIEATNEELLTTNQELQMRNEQLAESYNFSEAVAETMHEPMLILDKHFRVKSANKAFYKKFHLMQAGTEGILLHELSNHQWDIPELHQLLDNIIRKNTHFYEHEITYTFPETGKKTMLLNARPISQKTQNEQLILLTFTDTTTIIKNNKSDNKQLEDVISERTKALEESYQTVNEKNAFLEKANKELETFTFISSHDLQEPLRKIRLFTKSLLENENKNLSASGKGDLNKIQTTTERMQALIDDLLIYAGIKEGKKDYEKINLSKIVKEVADDFKDSIKDKRAEITIDGVCNTKVIVFQFRQVIHNLLENALKFTHAKRFPRINIKCEITPGRLLNFDGYLPEINYCHITVTDNGIGFDPKYKDRIFEVFQRLHGQQSYRGTGMGLAICKRIIENHKGVITATGRLNKGVTFDIYLPII